ncbi:netrin receptor UNC5D [Platysternon megacephalum]|uniref:Netrin receptor UNC5D n=1 Tax=Platysternon megacephalum TaxID=55544 RepID=A0A4D9ET89_9SAUR|nr:netrin receptor UNC5D [Platysternon megacephalum]
MADHTLIYAFLIHHVKTGGAIPQSHQLKRRYLSDIYNNQKLLVEQTNPAKIMSSLWMRLAVEQSAILNILSAPLVKDDSS